MFSPHNVGTTYSRVTGDSVLHCPCSGGSHTGFQDQPPRSSRTFHFTPVSYKSAEFQTQCLFLRSVLCHSGKDSSLSSTGMYRASFVGAQSVGGPWVAEQEPSVFLRSVLCHSGKDSSLSSTGMYRASFVGAQSVGGPWVAEQEPSVVPTQLVPLALVTTSSIGVEAGNGPTPGSWILSSPADLCPSPPTVVGRCPCPLSILTLSPSCSTPAAVIFTLSGSQESGSSSVLFKVLFMTKTL